MADLTLHGRRVETVFDLLGDKEDDITYSVGWGLSQSETLARALLHEAYGPSADGGELTAVRLQETDRLTGRTDIELETDQVRLVVEAKRGWQLPRREQLQKYADRLNNTSDVLDGRIVVVAECAAHFPAVAELPRSIDGIPVTYVPWSRVADLVQQTASASRNQAEKRLLRELHRYLKGLMSMQNTRDNLVYVVSLGREPLGNSGLTFETIVTERRRYFHPVGGGRGGWPKTPPNYLGFRYQGRLQQVRHVEGYELFDPEAPCPGMPELTGQLDWTPGVHFLYHLGDPIYPAHEVPAGPTITRALRVWASLDLLLTCDTIADARDQSRQRHELAGISFP